MDRDALFLAEVQELEHRVRSMQEYDTLMIAANLRKLLLDAEPLVHAVNRTRRVPIHFLANCEREDVESLRAKLVDTGLFMWTRLDGFDPHTARDGTPAELTLDALLRCVVVMWRGHEATVRDVIGHVAHVDGAVHLGTEKSEKDVALSEMAAKVRVGGAPPVTRQLQAIGRVVLTGLEPLVSRVVSDMAQRSARSLPPTRIPGLSASVFLGHLERMGFGYRANRSGASGGAAIEAVELFRFDDKFLYSVMVACDRGGVRLLTATVHKVQALPARAEADAAAGDALGQIAAIDAVSTDPERALTWVRANIGQPSATVTIGETFFEMDAATSDPGKQYRLNIAARGARPRSS